MSATVAFVLKGYPRLSETFIAQEILALERRGLDIVIVSLRQPTDTERHPIHEEIKAPVAYLPEFPLREPVRVLRAWRWARSRPGYGEALRQWLRDFRRGPSAARLRSFPQALVLAHELPSGVARLHAHFLHTPASVARFGAMILGLPWSCSAHARDIWTTPDWEKREKLLDADWVATCTAAGRDHLASLADRPDRITLAYHGLDLGRFPEPPTAESGRDGSRGDDPVVILSVGRAVEKKGFDTLLGALARLPGNLHWRLVHVGGGPLLPALRKRARKLNIDSRITWMGARAFDEVVACYRAADVFVLASRVAPDGDRDGLPNVLMEAQSQGLACVASDLGGVPELIEDGVTGLLVPPGREEPLAEAVARLAADPGIRSRLGAAGPKRVRERFSHEPGLDRLARRFGLEPAAIRECA
ncbi:MAG: glycosyltransferase [Rhodospirillales bacterium]